MNCLDDGKVASRGGRIMLIPRKAGFVVPVDVAPDGPRIKMKWLREKPARAPISLESVLKYYARATTLIGIKIKIETKSHKI